MDISAVLVFIVALAFGFIGFVQIYWSIKNAARRGSGFTFGTVLVWGAILAGLAYAIIRFTPYYTPLAMGYVVAAGILLVTQMIRVSDK